MTGKAGLNGRIAVLCGSAPVSYTHLWIGPRAELPPGDYAERIDLGGAWLTPGLIDCHTHAVFGGNRSGEFEQRLEGVSYAEIAAAGGGIALSLIHI